MRHAFDFVPIETPAGGPATDSLSLHFNRSEIVLLTLALPPVLLIIWLCAIQYNWQRGLRAVKHAVCLGPPAPRPLFLAGSAAGFVLVLGVSIMGGTATAAGVLSQPTTWVLILIPEAAWVAPTVLVCILTPLREVCQRLPARQVPARRGAFDSSHIR